MAQKDGLKMKRPKTFQILSRFHSSGGSHQITWQLSAVWKCCSELCHTACPKLNTKNSGATPHKCARSFLSLLRRSSLAHLSYSKFSVPLVWDWACVFSSVDLGVQISLCPQHLKQKTGNWGNSPVTSPLDLHFPTAPPRECSRGRAKLFEHVGAQAG